MISSEEAAVQSGEKEKVVLNRLAGSEQISAVETPHDAESGRTGAVPKGDARVESHRENMPAKQYIASKYIYIYIYKDQAWFPFH